MKKITVTTAERIQIIGVLNQIKGNIELLKAGLKDLDLIAITPEEKAEMNFTEVKNKEGDVISYKWDIMPDKEVELSSNVVEFIIKFVDEKNKQEVLGLADKPLVDVVEKLR